MYTALNETRTYWFNIYLCTLAPFIECIGKYDNVASYKRYYILCVHFVMYPALHRRPTIVCFLLQGSKTKLYALHDRHYTQREIGAARFAGLVSAVFRRFCS